MKRYPLSLLVEAAGCSEAALGRRVGLSGTTLKNARLTGFTEQAADRYAVRAELHPWVVWPEWYDELVVECAARDCAEQFVPRDSKGQQRFCSPRCRNRERGRRYRATEAGAEAARRTRRRYYWSDPRIRAREAAVKARPSARRAAATRRRQLRAIRRTEATAASGPENSQVASGTVDVMDNQEDAA